MSIQNSLTGLTSVPSIISPARIFIKEGKIMKVYINTQYALWTKFSNFCGQVCRRKAKERMVFLFSDMLLYAKQNILDRTDIGYYIHKILVVLYRCDIHYRTYECRCALPLLNSSVQLIFGDPRVPQVSTLIRVCL